MKVLITADTIGGVWTYAVDLARGLSTRGVEIALATMGASVSDAQRNQLSFLDNVTLFESNYKLEWMNDPWQDVRRSGDWLLEIEQKFQPDIVHLNGYAHGGFPFKAPKLVAGHSCVLSWWEACRGEPAPAQWNRYREQVRSGLSAADLVVTPTHAMLAHLEKHYGSLNNVQVIPNGRQAERYNAATEKEPFVLAAGRLWDDAKNLATLDAAAASLGCPVYVAGDQRHPDGGTASSTAIRLLGKLDEPTLAEWYSRAAVYALPARYEPFGLSILEAALSGCALVLGDIPSLRENWEHAAAFVPPNEAGQLRHTIQRLMDDPVRRRELAQRSIHRAMRFTLAACANAYFAAYQDLLGAASDKPFSRSAHACVS
jgi:glycosyltransferase involved in cell wall biosynthesis